MDTQKPILDTYYVSFSREGNTISPRSPKWSPPTLSSPFNYRRFLSTPTPELKSRGTRSQPTVPPPPDVPHPWVWQCHLCRNRYPLGVTRRCLYDGHYYCSGEASQPNVKKKKKAQACSSEFDYEGWAEYGQWRQIASKEVKNLKVLRACETCAFPSQCRTPAALIPKSVKNTGLSHSFSIIGDAEEDARPDITNENPEDVVMAESNAVEQPIGVGFDIILKDLMRDEGELLHVEVADDKQQEGTSGDREARWFQGGQIQQESQCER